MSQLGESVLPHCGGNLEAAAAARPRVYTAAGLYVTTDATLLLVKLLYKRTVGGLALHRQYTQVKIVPADCYEGGNPQPRAIAASIMGSSTATMQSGCSPFACDGIACTA